MLTVISALPNGAHGMDHMLTGKIIAQGDLRIARLTSAQSEAFFIEPDASCAVNSAIHSAATQQRTIGGVYDGIDFHFSNIPMDDLERHIAFPRYLCGWANGSGGG